MRIHHTKHHQSYVDKLNAALEGYNGLQKRYRKLIRSLKDIPEEIGAAVRNHGGGYLNHSLFWLILKRVEGEEASGKLREAIEKRFGSLKKFRKASKMPL